LAKVQKMKDDAQAALDLERAQKEAALAHTIANWPEIVPGDTKRDIIREFRDKTSTPPRGLQAVGRWTHHPFSRLLSRYAQPGMTVEPGRRFQALSRLPLQVISG
jgi:hypothetical protein